MEKYLFPFRLKWPSVNEEKIKVAIKDCPAQFLTDL